MIINSTKSNGKKIDSAGAWAPPILPVPRDGQDPAFVKSFAPSEVSAYIEFFKTYGFVVVRDVLTPQQCQESIDDIWKYADLILRMLLTVSIATSRVAPSFTPTSARLR